MWLSCGSTRVARRREFRRRPSMEPMHSCLLPFALEFGVPVSHIECRVVSHYESAGVNTAGKDVDNIYADCGPGAELVGKGLTNVIWDGGDYIDMYGSEFHRVAIVGGTRVSGKEGTCTST
ncbi:Hypothetical protein, putative [Bodo saltans]|uniref:Uncharacterized protein n=1 Tax=Bodo saltans TaxID=75058 RepID=A0A0S4KI19_BODSA|nr:Hypothetical protein, putative [Bodo saltans]|eukprot:CUI14773.1 Hypothetical protein, putative [Bodo saltans]